MALPSAGRGFSLGCNEGWFHAAASADAWRPGPRRRRTRHADTLMPVRPPATISAWYRAKEETSHDPSLIAIIDRRRIAWFTLSGGTAQADTCRAASRPVRTCRHGEAAAGRVLEAAASGAWRRCSSGERGQVVTAGYAAGRQRPPRATIRCRKRPPAMPRRFRMVYDSGPGQLRTLLRVISRSRTTQPNFNRREPATAATSIDRRSSRRTRHSDAIAAAYIAQLGQAAPSRRRS